MGDLVVNFNQVQKRPDLNRSLRQHCFVECYFVGYPKTYVNALSKSVSSVLLSSITFLTLSDAEPEKSLKYGSKVQS